MEIEGNVQIYSLKQELLGKHQLSGQKVATVTNTNHRRDISTSIDQMMGQTSGDFTNVPLALGYLSLTRTNLPQYTRDHLQIMIKLLKNNNKITADKTLDFCIENNFFSGNNWAEVYNALFLESQKQELVEKIVLLNKANLIKAEEKPQTSNIEQYEKIINPKSQHIAFPVTAVLRSSANSTIF